MSLYAMSSMTTITLLIALKNMVYQAMFQSTTGAAAARPDSHQ
jgi:hypothetical protein